MTLVPFLKASGEHKSKPTQHSVKELQGLGISPDIIVLRCDEPITDESIFRKIAGFCNVKPDCVIENLTLSVLYEAPLYLERFGFSSIVCRELGIDAPAPDLREWKTMVVELIPEHRTQQQGMGEETYLYRLRCSCYHRSRFRCNCNQRILPGKLLR